MTVRGGSTITYRVQGVSGIRKALRPWLEPELTREIDAANKKAANALAKELRSAMRPVSKHMAKAVRVKRARTGKPGWIVGSRRKVAFFWPFVIGGTKAHGPRRAKALVFIPGWNPYLGVSSHGAGNQWVRASRVKGVPANDIVERVATAGESKAMREVDNHMTKSTGT